MQIVGGKLGFERRYAYMESIDLNEEQVENIETRLNLFDRNYISYKMNVFVIMKMQKIIILNTFS